MEIGSILIVLLIMVIMGRSYFLIKKNIITIEKDSKCILSKILLPFGSLFKLWTPNNILFVDFIKKNSLIINTQQKEIFIIEVNDYININEDFIHELYRDYSLIREGFFFQVILKNDDYQKKYIISYSYELLNVFVNKTNANFLSGKESIKILKKILFLDIENEKIDLNISLQNKQKKLISQFEVYQGYKAKEGNIEDLYNKLLKTDCKCAIWGYYDFYQGRVNGYISSKLKNNEFLKNSEKLILINHILITDNISKDSLNKISNIYNISLVKKSINNKDLLLKSPIKHRDVNWDLLVNLDYLTSQFISKG